LNLKSRHLKIINDKLHLTYFNASSLSRERKSSWTSIHDLYEDICKSCYIPALGDENGSLVGTGKDGKYFIDGGLPYIFGDGSREILYVSLVHLKNLNGILSTNGEKKHDARILQGLIDTYDFYKNGGTRPTIMCSWYNKWSFRDVFINKIKVLSVNIFFIMCSIIFHILPTIREIWKVFEQTLLNKLPIYNIIKPLTLFILTYIKYFIIELIIYML